MPVKSKLYKRRRASDKGKDLKLVSQIPLFLGYATFHEDCNRLHYNFLVLCIYPPKVCISRINSFRNTFVWKYNIESHNSARVAWNKVVAWFIEVILQVSIHNYGTTKPKVSFSWLANKLLKLKDEVFPLIKQGLENGLTARFWNDAWRILQARSDEQLELHAYLTTVEFTKNMTSMSGRSMVRCPTRDRLIKWGLKVPLTYLLCNSEAESRNHLFHECNFSFDMWSMSANRLRIQPNRLWDQNVNPMQQLPRQRGHRPLRLLTLLAWQSTIYWTWSERNTRLH
ncbi:hypothetical protein F2Q69_00047224 [Brassica cretica]|uniref:Reverse transcriptase zinc-binding domain-containing protein n=1 Tax=Brassica cretica TaxID=69181 RepID=A0A8S9PVK1_BRACR|nr:hypothetical protein F2Q69_00047224 [Brassica cretica]